MNSRAAPDMRSLTTIPVHDGYWKSSVFASRPHKTLPTVSRQRSLEGGITGPAMASRCQRSRGRSLRIPRPPASRMARSVTMAAVSAETAAMVTERAIRLAGGRGILKDLPLERWHRDAMAGPVIPPSNDRCLETVGKILCGLEARTLDFQ